MEFKDCRKGMQVVDASPEAHTGYRASNGFVGTIIDLDPASRSILVDWYVRGHRAGQGRYVRYIPHLTPYENDKECLSPATQRSFDKVVQRVQEKSDEDRLYQFFAVCTAPGCCPKCSAPKPCKYHP